MNWIFRLERKLGRNFGIPGMMMYITATMLAVYVAGFFFMPMLRTQLILYWPLVLRGEIWRVLTFIFIPPVWDNMLLLLLSLYVAYFIGNSLENAWGTTLFTLYYALGVLGAIIAAVISGMGTNYYIYLSMFLAYAYLYPDATFMLFFILPVKAKHLALVNWALYLYAFITGSVSHKVAILFSLVNFFVFFGPKVRQTVIQNYKLAKRRREYRKNWGNNNPWG